LFGCKAGCLVWLLLDPAKEHRVVARIPDKVFGRFLLVLAPEYSDDKDRAELLAKPASLRGKQPLSMCES
jgi:hypothetical protein